jgi:hypothetical protein
VEGELACKQAYKQVPKLFVEYTHNETGVITGVVVVVLVLVDVVVVGAAVVVVVQSAKLEIIASNI